MNYILTIALSEPPISKNMWNEDLKEFKSLFLFHFHKNTTTIHCQQLTTHILKAINKHWKCFSQY